MSEYILTGQLTDQIMHKLPGQIFSIKRTVREWTVDEKNRLEQELQYLTARYSMDEIVSGYLFYTNSVMEEMKYFQEHGSYRYSSFAEVGKYLYADPKRMKLYMLGLSVAEYFWTTVLKIHRFFERLIQNVSGRYFLEIGPGHGKYFLEAYQLQLFQRYDAVDVSETAIAMTKDYFTYNQIKGDNYRLICQDATKMTTDDTYDFVVMQEVLEHIEDPLGMLVSIRHLLAPDGRVYALFPVNAPSPAHIFLFKSIDHVKEMVTAAGFLIEQEEYITANNMSIEQARKKKMPVDVCLVLRINRMEHLFNRLIDLSAVQPDKPAVIFKNEQLTYRTLCLKIAGMAQILREKGIRKGDSVCISAVSKPEMVAAYQAVQACGAIAVFLDKYGTPENMAFIYREADAKLLLTDKPMKEYAAACETMSLRELYRLADRHTRKAAGQELSDWKIAPLENDIAELLFTAGTTGKPKGVILTYQSVYHILIHTIEGIGVRDDDRLLLPLPLNHSFALRVLRAVLYQGATVILQNGFTFAREAENNIVRFGCNALAAVPASYEVMKSQMQDSFGKVLGNMRYLEFSAGALSIRQRKEITGLLPGVKIYNTWGSSETGGAIFCDVTQTVRDPEKAGSAGRPLPQVQVQFVDPQGNTIQGDATHPGCLALKGDMLFAGYWKQPKLTQKALADGWYVTGDMGYRDADGFIYLMGRMDDMINAGGEKVSPAGVENIAGQYPYIRECACVGVDDPDGMLGQIPVLFVAVKNGYTEEGMLKFLSERMERYKIPKELVVVEAIPKNSMLKADRNQLRMIWEQKDTLHLMNPVMQALLSRRSIRRFTSQEIPSPVLNMILKAGYHAPSGHNMQSWKFTVILKPEDISHLKEKTRAAAKKNGIYFYGWENPKTLILISNDKRNPYGCQDASCAAENMMLAAASYGLGSVWLNPLMTLRHAEPVKDILDAFHIPENHIVWAAIALGYPAAEGVLLQKKEKVVEYIK